MRLNEIMSSPAESIGGEEPVATALGRMQQQGVHHLLVLEGGRPAGIVTRWSLERTRREGTVREAMTDEVLTASPRDTIKDAANRMRGRGVGLLAVVDESGRLQGVVTIADLLEVVGKGQVKLITQTAHRPPLRARARRPKPIATR